MLVGPLARERASCAALTASDLQPGPCFSWQEGPLGRRSVQAGVPAGEFVSGKHACLQCIPLCDLESDTPTDQIE
jgi:hypothetical protein